MKTGSRLDDTRTPTMSTAGRQIDTVLAKLIKTASHLVAVRVILFS